MMTENPWKDLDPPNAAEALRVHRVDAEIPWDFFWARDLERRYLLILQHDCDVTPTSRLPKLRDIEIDISKNGKDGKCTLAFRLTDPSHRDVFHRLCVDIVDACREAVSEEEAISHSLARTWRWHHLLRGGSDGRLSPEEQKGLIGELQVLNRILMPNMPAIDAVRSWRGPLDAPKDFEVGHIAIEAKARRGTARPFVSISSEFQLDIGAADRLFLHVAEVDEAPSNAKTGFTVSDFAGQIRNTLVSTAPDAVDAFESLILAVGFDWDDDYSDFVWVEGESKLFEVSAGFPRLTPVDVHTGVSNVRYSISLVDCEPFQIGIGELESVIKEG